MLSTKNHTTPGLDLDAHKIQLYLVMGMPTISKSYGMRETNQSCASPFQSLFVLIGTIISMLNLIGIS